jgi:hypothetical protein
MLLTMRPDLSGVYSSEAALEETSVISRYDLALRSYSFEGIQFIRQDANPAC